MPSAFDWRNAAEKFRRAFYRVVDYLNEKENMGAVLNVDDMLIVPSRFIDVNDSGLIVSQTDVRFYKKVLCPTLARMFWKYQLIPKVNITGTGPPGAYFSAPLDPFSSVREYNLHLYPGGLYTGKGNTCIGESSVPSLVEFLRTVVGIRWDGA